MEKRTAIDQLESIENEARGLVFARKELTPLFLLKSLLLVIGILVTASLVALLLRFGFGLSSRETFGFINLFELNNEGNIPTWFSSAQLGAAAALLLFIARMKFLAADRWARHWAFLGIIFVFLSMDEIARIHERTTEVLNSLYAFHGLLRNSWVLLAIPFLLILLFVLSNFIRNLPKRTGVFFCLSGAVYVGGVVGIEMLSGLAKDEVGTSSVRFAVTVTVEETLELLGIAFFLASLLHYIQNDSLFARGSGGKPR